MFSKGFHKIAATVVTMTPEEHFEHVGQKDKYVGALVGNVVGAAAGLAKGKTGSKASTALTSGLVGTGLGGLTGYLGGKVLRKYQANRVHRMAGDLNLKATPGRRTYGSQEG
jgi:hypothetical protein